MTSSSEEPRFDAGNGPTDRRSWQFGLKHLFGLTTLVALAAALIAAFGARAVPPSVGILWTWLNLCGAFHFFQQGRAQKRLLWLAWATFLVSLALPSLRVFTTGWVYGWQAAMAVIQLPYFAVVKPSWSDVSVSAGLVCLVVNFANGLAVLMPLLIWRLGRGTGQRMGAALCLTAVSTWVLWDSQMLVGYYVWCVSFLLAQAALPVNRQLFGGTAALTIVLGALRASDPEW